MDQNKMINRSEAGFEDYGYLKKFVIDWSAKKKVLITGAQSYIGESFKCWAKKYYDKNIEVDTLDMKNNSWRRVDFSSYDCVLHVAGIAHVDTGKISAGIKKNYYAVNTKLAIEAAKKAKGSGVKQFVLMSSMIIYGEPAAYEKYKNIDEHSMPSPSGFYGDSKWKADKMVRNLSNDDFHVAVLRLPMVYGKGAKGNYPLLSKIARKLPVFPDIDNKRSILHIDNLCEFLCKLIVSGENGIYFPQNKKQVKTSDIVEAISVIVGKKIILTKSFNPLIGFISHLPGRIPKLVNKAFGTITYSQTLSRYDGLEYQVNDWLQSIRLTEK